MSFHSVIFIPTTYLFRPSVELSQPVVTNRVTNNELEASQPVVTNQVTNNELEASIEFSAKK